MDTTGNNKYDEIIEKYSSSISPPPATTSTPVAPLPPPEPKPVQPATPLYAESSDQVQNSGLLVKIFRLAAILSFVIFLGVLVKVIYNTIQDQSLYDLTKVKIIPPTPTVTPTPFENYVCLLNDIRYKAGESFMSADGCNKCVCQSDGTISCDTKSCASTPTVSATKKASPTPVLTQVPVCTFNGKTYKVGETYKDSCNTCLCTDGGTATCTKKSCP